MKIGFITLVKLIYHTSVFVLMRYLSNHVVDKKSTELINYQIEVHRQAIRRMLNCEYDKMFGE